MTKLNAAGSTCSTAPISAAAVADEGFGIAVDAAGSAYVTGHTQSTNFPTVNPVQATNGGGFDAFVTKLNAAGSTLLYSTYLGGSGGDRGLRHCRGRGGQAYVTGFTGSTNFPTVNPVQATNGGGDDAFVTKLSAAGSTLLYSTYLGGSDVDLGLRHCRGRGGQRLRDGLYAIDELPDGQSGPGHERGRGRCLRDETQRRGLEPALQHLSRRQR